MKHVIEPESSSRKIKALKEEIKELKSIIGEKQIQLDFKDKQIELAEKFYKVDIKKKLKEQHLSGSGQTEKSTDTK